MRFVAALTALAGFLPLGANAALITELFRVTLPYNSGPYAAGHVFDITATYDNTGTIRHTWFDGPNGIAEFGRGDDELLEAFEVGDVGYDDPGLHMSDAHISVAGIAPGGLVNSGEDFNYAAVSRQASGGLEVILFGDSLNLSLHEEAGGYQSVFIFDRTADGSRMISIAGTGLFTRSTVPVVEATDNFDRFNGNLGSSWSTNVDAGGSLQIVSNRVQPARRTYGESFYTGSSFSRSQFSEIQLTSGLAGGVINLVVRGREYTGGNFSDSYRGQLNGLTGQWRIIRVDNNVETVLANGALSYANGDTFAFIASGAGLTLTRNGGTLGGANDTLYDGGVPGLGIYNRVSLLVDDWHGGEYPTPDGTPPSAPGVIVTDSFNRANGGLGSGWTQAAISTSALQIVNNQVQTPARTYSESIYTGSAFGANQFAEVQYVSGLAAGVINLVLRARQYTLAGQGDGYIGQLNGLTGLWRILRVDNNGETPLAAGVLSYAANDVFTFAASGTTLTLSRNHSTLGSATSDVYQAGAPGLGVYAKGPLLIDDFRAESH